MDNTSNTKNHAVQGGDTWEVGGEQDVLSGGVLDVKSGGEADVESGGTLDIKAGATFTLFGQPIASGADFGLGTTASAAELDVLDGNTATTAELSSLHDEIASMTTSATPASGTNGAQFVFKNAAGVAVTGRRSLRMYISDANGDPVAAATGFATLTNGVVDELTTGKEAAVVTSAAGLLGVTLTHSAGTYRLSFVLPNGKILTSGALVVNA